MMQGMPDPSGFDRGRMEGQAESVRAHMADTRHDEQLREAERAERKAKKGETGSIVRRIARWFRRGG